MAKLLAIDIETAPILSYNWGLYEQTAIKKIKPTTILSFAYQWFPGKTEVVACDLHSEFQLLAKLHKLLDEAEIVIAHNGDSFDIKKINSRLIIHKFKPPSPYRTIDTKKEAKRVAAFDSNSLNNLGIDLDEGEKVKHRGFDMWEGCMAGNSQDWADMKRYNKKDVDLLCRIYLRLRPWMKTHHEESGKCRCGSVNSQSRGTFRNKNSAYRRLRCNDCGAWRKGALVKE